MGSASTEQQSTIVSGFFILTTFDALVEYESTTINLSDLVYRRPLVSRVQLALNVPDIDSAVAFYSKLFATEPAKRKPGYANFAIVDPPLKLVLFEKADAEARLNHLGVEVASSDEVWSHQQRLADDGVDSVEESGTCCFAKQDKVWVDGPDGAWEIYTVLEDSDTFGRSETLVDDTTGDSLCCASVPEAEARCC
jgi:catechol 2,3-dioxygenase-like lactoylglutathione lyase family enzyme